MGDNRCCNSAINACPLCGSNESNKFFTVNKIPIHVSHFAETWRSARNVTMGQLELVDCCQCGFIWNRFFQPEKVVFEPGYEVSL